MRVKVGDVKFGKVLCQVSHGYEVFVYDEIPEIVYAQCGQPLKNGDEVSMTYKSFSVGCFWEAEPIGEV